ncbi:hypothetical protein BIW11_08625 [Tropilaelaps mercedesae]|uniref:Uncharacterized protein n=1 Tax=Tropilaelaps mercedesae TaxID=418985 RepID=A0A1V9XNQ2_9ACAR|nr:hypothetical protein BIW11_08625 [Tropilaelaps mercedesae]
MLHLHKPGRKQRKVYFHYPALRYAPGPVYDGSPLGLDALLGSDGREAILHLEVVLQSDRVRLHNPTSVETLRPYLV